VPEQPDAGVYAGREAVRRGFYEGTSDAGEWSVEPREFTPAGDQLFVAAKMWVMFLQRDKALDAAGHAE